MGHCLFTDSWRQNSRFPTHSSLKPQLGASCYSWGRLGVLAPYRVSTYTEIEIASLLMNGDKCPSSLLGLSDINSKGDRRIETHQTGEDGGLGLLLSLYWGDGIGAIVLSVMFIWGTVIIDQKLSVLLGSFFPAPLARQNRLVLGYLLSVPFGVSSSFSYKFGIYEAKRKPSEQITVSVPWILRSLAGLPFLHLSICLYLFYI